MSEKFIDREYLLDSFKDYNTDIVEKKFDQVNSNLSGSQVDVAYKSHFGVLTANEGRYGYEWNNLTKGQYTLKATNADNSLYIYVGYKRNGEVSSLDNIAPRETKEFVFDAQENDTILMWLDSAMSTNIFSNVSLFSWQIGKEVDNVNESLGSLGKCKNLLNPTLRTTTVNGITCTDNGDGTYTLNGTAGEHGATFRTCELKIQEYLGKTLRVVGCPKSGSATTYHMFFTDNQNSSSSLTDLGEGATKIVEQWGSSEYWVLYITIKSGVTVSNVVFKPMITTDLNATYDDFVPYTGDGDTLSADVASLKNDLGGLSFSVSGTTLSITDGTNTWTLSQ